jgi:putative aminopeptidase FrvX
MSDETLDLLRELTEASGISGYEHEVRNIIRKQLQDITSIRGHNPRLNKKGPPVGRAHQGGGVRVTIDFSCL